MHQNRKVVVIANREQVATPIPSWASVRLLRNISLSLIAEENVVALMRLNLSNRLDLVF